MASVGADAGAETRLSEAEVSQAAAPKNMETTLEDGKAPHTGTVRQEDKTDQTTKSEPPSVAANTRKPANIEELHERLTAMESQFHVLDRILDLQPQDAIQAEDDDAKPEISDEDREFKIEKHETVTDVMRYVRSALGYLHELEWRHQRSKRDRLRQEAAKNIRVDRAQQESARQISTTAFLKGEAAAVSWVDWEVFLSRKGEAEDSLMAPIQAVIGEPEPQLMLQLAALGIQKPSSNSTRGKLVSTRAADRAAERAAGGESPGQAPLPERVKIHSGALYAIFAHRLDKDRQWAVGEDGTMVFLRPFRALVYHEKRLREILDELEKRYEGWDGMRYPPVKGTDARDVGDAVEGNISKDDRGLEANAEPGQAQGPKTEEETKEEEDENERTPTSITALLHMRCLVKFIDEEIRPKIEYIESDRCERILFHDLWHLFKPGDEVVDQSEKQAYRVVRVQIPQHKIEDPWLRWYRKPSRRRKDEDEEDDNGETPVIVHCAYIDYDGKQFGPVSVRFSVPPFGGLKDIRSLPIYPLRFAKKRQLRQALIDRGKMLLDIAKFKPMYYVGLTLDSREEIDSQVVVDFSEALGEAASDEKRKDWAPTIESLRTAPNERDDDACRAACCASQAVQDEDYIDSRLTEDFVKSLIPRSSLRAPSLILSPRPLEATMPGSEDEPTEEEFVVMTYRAFAFVLRSRKWGKFASSLFTLRRTSLAATCTDTNAQPSSTSPS
jgi:hypothetical protein